MKEHNMCIHEEPIPNDCDPWCNKFEKFCMKEGCPYLKDTIDAVIELFEGVSYSEEEKEED